MAQGWREKETAFLCCLLGALKAGRAYVPIDRTVPRERAAQIAKRALKTGASVRQIVLDEGWMTEEQLNRCLDVKDMTQPGHLVEYAKVMPAEEELEKKERVGQP